MKLQRERPDDAARLVAKIRGYEIALQDDAFAFIARHFPETKLISAQNLWRGISRTTPKFNRWPESWGGDDSLFDAAWIGEHVQRGHGALGADYPSADYLWEGDTPAFLNLIPNGLHFPEQVPTSAAGAGASILCGRRMSARGRATTPSMASSTSIATTTSSVMPPTVGSGRVSSTRTSMLLCSAGVKISSTISQRASIAVSAPSPR